MQTISKEKLIATIEQSNSVSEAVDTLGTTRQNISKRLKKYGLKIIQVKKLKVVRR